MPNCLRTAMKRMMTTPMANSSMPWIPMTAERRGGGGAHSGPSPGGDERKPWPARVTLGRASQQQVFSTEMNRDVTGISLVGGRLHGFVSRPRTHSMRTRPENWMKAVLMSTLMLKWKICGSRHIWKTSLSGPVRENGGCVMSHLLQCIKGDV